MDKKEAKKKSKEYDRKLMAIAAKLPDSQVNRLMSELYQLGQKHLDDETFSKELDNLAKKVTSDSAIQEELQLLLSEMAENERKEVESKPWYAEDYLDILEEEEQEKILSTSPIDKYLYFFASAYLSDSIAKTFRQSDGEKLSVTAAISQYLKDDADFYNAIVQDTPENERILGNTPLPNYPDGFKKAMDEYCTINCLEVNMSLIRKYFYTLFRNYLVGGSSVAKEYLLNLYKKLLPDEAKRIRRYSTITARQLVVDGFLPKDDAERCDPLPICGIVALAVVNGTKIDKSIYYALYHCKSCYEDVVQELNNNTEEASKILESSYQMTRSMDTEKVDEKVVETAARIFGNTLSQNGMPLEESYWYLDETELGDKLPMINQKLLQLDIDMDSLSHEELTSLIKCLITVQDNLVKNLRVVSFDEFLRLAAGGNNAHRFLSSGCFATPTVTKPKENTEEIKKKAEELVSLQKEKYEALVMKLNAELSEAKEEAQRSKSKLSQKDSQIESQRKLYEDEKEKNRSMAAEIKEAKEQTAELVALRKFVEELGEEETDTGLSVREMKSYIERKSVVIIGGHENWVAKMRSEFPKWTYLAAAEQGSIPAAVVNKADYTFFFSAHICHPQYYKFISHLRTHNLPFGYISQTNMEQTIRQIFTEITAED